MPWKIVEGDDRCPASEPFAVVKEDDGDLEGCHATQDGAQQQLSALYANEDDANSVSPSLLATELRDVELVRAVPARVELRADADTGMPTMVGHFSIFNRWYEIDSFFEGRFLERTAAGAFSKTIRESGGSVKVLYDHGMDFHIGNKVLGPVNELREDDIGPYYEVPLLDTSYVRDLLPGLEAGLYGSSFRFRVTRDEWNDDPGRSATNPDGLPERTVKEVRLFEFGPVTFPANPDATAGVRCLTDDYYDRVRSRSPQRYEELLSRVRSLRTPDTDAALVGTSVEGAADPTDAPALDSHPSGLNPSERRARLYPFLQEQT